MSESTCGFKSRQPHQVRSGNGHLLYARVVELADSLDSGSSVHSGRAGSTPASRTGKNNLCLPDKGCFFGEVDPFRDLRNMLYSTAASPRSKIDRRIREFRQIRSIVHRVDVGSGPYDRRFDRTQPQIFRFEAVSCHFPKSTKGAKARTQRSKSAEGHG